MLYEPFIDTVLWKGKNCSMRSQALNFNLNYSQCKVPNPRIKGLLIPLTMIFPSLSKALYVKKTNK